MSQQDAIMADARAFMKSRVILTAAELDLFTRLAEGPATAHEVAKELALDERAAERVLDCLVTFGLLDKEGGRYTNTGKGAFYSAHHPESILPMVRHYGSLWETWSRLTEIVRRGGNPDGDPGIHMDEENWESFIGAMHVVARGLSQEVAGAYDLSRFKRLMDIGGASGTYTLAFLEKNPAMRGVIFDLSGVISMARKRIAGEGLADRVDLVAGDFYHDELPAGCDLALLSAIIHQNSQAENIDLYRKIFRALEPGGTLLIRDHIMDETRTRPPAGALFAINMLVNTRGGDTYTFEEVKDSLEEAGFSEVKMVRYGEGMDCLVEAKKPV